MRSDTPTDLLRLPAGIELEDARLIDRLQHSLPTTERPFADIAAELGMAEPQVIERLHRLLKSGVLTRFGPLFHIERAGGQFILAALQVPDERYADVTALVNVLGPVARVAAVGGKGRDRRTILVGERAGFEFPVEVPTMVNAVFQFEQGATGQSIFSFDSHLTRTGVVEISGTEGTLSIPDPNTFGGEVRLTRAPVDSGEPLDVSPQKWETLAPVGVKAGRGLGVHLDDQLLRQLERP